MEIDGQVKKSKMKIVFLKDKNKTPKKREFSKIWLGCCIVLSIIFTATSYILAAFDKNPVSELSQTIIETIWGTSGVSFIGYAMQNSVRAYTASKFGIPKQKRGDNNADK